MIEYFLKITYPYIKKTIADSEYSEFLVLCMALLTPWGSMMKFMLSITGVVFLLSLYITVKLKFMNFWANSALPQVTECSKKTPKGSKHACKKKSSIDKKKSSISKKSFPISKEESYCRKTFYMFVYLVLLYVTPWTNIYLHLTSLFGGLLALAWVLLFMDWPSEGDNFDELKLM